MATGIKSWSTTAGNNDTADSSINWAENQAPSTVNNSARAMMAAIRTQYNQTEWRDWGHTVTYATAATFTIAADVTAIYTAGRAIHCSDATELYGLVVSSSYSSPNTTVTVSLLSGSLSASLSYVELGPEVTNPSTAWGSIRFDEGASVASAADCNIWASGAHLVHVTGTTTISDWGTAPYAGAWMMVEFDGALTLTYNATTNDMNTSSTNYTTVAGDRAIVYADSTSAYKVTIFPYTGTTAAAQAIDLIKLNVTEPLDQWYRGDASLGALSYTVNTAVDTGVYRCSSYSIDAGVTVTLNTGGQGAYIILCTGTVTIPATAIIDGTGAGSPGADVTGTNNGDLDYYGTAGMLGGAGGGGGGAQTAGGGGSDGGSTYGSVLETLYTPAQTATNQKQGVLSAINSQVISAGGAGNSGSGAGADASAGGAYSSTVVDRTIPYLDVFHSALYIAGGAGGGGGGSNVTPGAGFSDGGAGGAGVLIIAKTINFAGTMTLVGAAGGASDTSGDDTGGGGGGGGGAVVFIAESITDTGTKTLTGGAGGAGSTSGDGGAGATGWSKNITVA